MFRTDTGNFNRFLTSLGLLMILGSLLIPYFFFRDTDTLRIPFRELKALTPVARDALESRQHRVHDLEAVVLISAATLALGGVAALWLGGRRLRVAQGKEDAEIDRKAKRDDLEFQKMSQSEVDEKREEQVRESVKDEEPVFSAGQEAEDSPASPDDPAIRIHDSRVAWLRIETATKEVLERSEFAAYDFLYEVKSVRGAQQLQLDGIFRTENRDGVDVLLELKVVRQTRAIRGRIRQYSDQLLALQTRYRRISHRAAIGWLLIVLPSETTPPSIEERRRVEEEFDQSLVGIGRSTVIHESELDDLPYRFGQLFESQAK